MNRRRTDGDETWNRLINWTKGQKPSERLAAHILRTDGYKSVDPSHPLGGKDGLKDMVCSKENITWIGASYFPRTQKGFSDTKDKFYEDLQGVSKNNVSGIAFITNQELSLKERSDLKAIGKPHTVEIYHLERISGILDMPENYGLRLEFLDIELSKEEQLAFFANRDEKIFSINEKLDYLMSDYSSFKKSIEFGLENEGFHERTSSSVLDAIDELTDKIWYDRHQLLRYRIDQGLTEVDSKIWKGALKSAKSVEDKYGVENLGPHGDFEWGMLNGKLSALRWLLGDEWDMLDT